MSSISTKSMSPIKENEGFNSMLFLSPNKHTLDEYNLNNEITTPNKSLFENDFDKYNMNLSPSENLQIENFLSHDFLLRLDQCSPAKPIEIIKEKNVLFSNETNYLIECYQDKNLRDIQIKNNNNNINCAFGKKIDFDHCDIQKNKFDLSEFKQKISVPFKNTGFKYDFKKNKKLKKNPKTKEKKYFEREGDWCCYKCKNMNFTFRNYCNRCNYSKENSENDYEKVRRNMLSLIK